MGRDAKSQGHKAKIHYAAIRKRNRKGEWIWGVVRYEGRQEKWGTVGPGDEGKRDARQAALQLNRSESRKSADGERYLWSPASISAYCARSARCGNFLPC